MKTIEEFCRRVVAAVAALDRSAGFLRKTAQLIANLRPVLTIDRDTGAPQLTVDARSSGGISSLEDVMDMLSSLTPIQSAVLKGLARNSNLKPFSGDFMSECGIRNVGTVTRALTRLSADEIIYEHAGVWRFTNPFFREWLNIGDGVVVQFEVQ